MKKKPKVNQVPPPEPANTACCAGSPLEYKEPDSDAVKLTRELETLVHQIESHRSIMACLSREHAEYKDRLAAATLNHAELRVKLANALEVPRLIG